MLRQDTVSASPHVMTPKPSASRITPGSPELLTTQPDGTLSEDALSALGQFDNVVIAGDCFAVDASVEGALASAGVAAYRAPDAASLVARGREEGIYAEADATYTATSATASISIPYAVCAARSRTPFLIS